MAFKPLSGETSSALLGVAEPTKLSLLGSTDAERLGLADIAKSNETSYYGKRIHAPSDESSKKIIIVVIISALIFVSVISLFDVLKSLVNNFILVLPIPTEWQDFSSSFVFSVLTIIISIILIYLLVKFLLNY